MEARQGGGGETEKGEDQGRVIRIRWEVGTEGSSVLKLILLPTWHELLLLSGVTIVRGRCNIKLFSGLTSTTLANVKTNELGPGRRSWITNY